MVCPLAPVLSSFSAAKSRMKYSLPVMLWTLSLANAQNNSPSDTSKATVAALPKTVSNLPKLDSKTVAAANQQQQAAGITDICSQSLSRVAQDWKTAQSSVNQLVVASKGSPVEAAADAAQKSLETEASVLNSRAGTKIDTTGVQAYENAGVAIGQAMGAVSQIRQVTGQKQEVTTAANQATLDLQTLRTSQFATFGACGAAIGATIGASDEVRPAGIPGATTKVVCQA